MSHGTLLRSISPPPKAAHNDLTLCSAFAQRPVVIRFVTQSHLSSGKSRSLRVAFVPIVIFPDAVVFLFVLFFFVFGFFPQENIGGQ